MNILEEFWYGNIALQSTTTAPTRNTRRFFIITQSSTRRTMPVAFIYKSLLLNLTNYDAIICKLRRIILKNTV